MLITDSQENYIWYWTLEQFDMLNQFSLTIQQQKNYRYKKPPGTCIISKHILFRYSIIKNIICTSILPTPHPHPIVQQQVTA